MKIQSLILGVIVGLCGLQGHAQKINDLMPVMSRADLQPPLLVNATPFKQIHGSEASKLKKEMIAVLDNTDLFSLSCDVSLGEDRDGGGTSRENVENLAMDIKDSFSIYRSATDPNLVKFTHPASESFQQYEIAVRLDPKTHAFAELEQDIYKKKDKKSALSESYDCHVPQ